MRDPDTHVLSGGYYSILKSLLSYIPIDVDLYQKYVTQMTERTLRSMTQLQYTVSCSSESHRQYVFRMFSVVFNLKVNYSLVSNNSFCLPLIQALCKLPSVKQERQLLKLPNGYRESRRSSESRLRVRFSSWAQNFSEFEQQTKRILEL